MKELKTLFTVMLVSIIIAIAWNSVPGIRAGAHSALDPTLGTLLDLHLNIGFLIATAIIALITTIVQKYATDQATIKQIKQEQKALQAEMKQYKEHPEKLMELQKKSMELVFKTMPLTMRPLVYTAVPFILLFRWFGDYFIATPVKIFGFFSWLWAYILFSIVFSSIFRKAFNVH
ncbi:hypothetical protein COU54_02625 [Candidatus Pacearchaeota archaeon CG10_big_fil_rev_8_21_14_0_10_31_24]|nr:MAG: hypothetical protein COU54_02625 [Candidatus Pacearchaeota archaeon CG10_big_fil_rev_8_21_14_0_10_31_24]